MLFMSADFPPDRPRHARQDCRTTLEAWERICHDQLRVKRDRRGALVALGTELTCLVLQDALGGTVYWSSRRKSWCFVQGAPSAAPGDGGSAA